MVSSARIQFLIYQFSIAMSTLQKVTQDESRFNLGIVNPRRIL